MKTFDDYPPNVRNELASMAEAIADDCESGNGFVPINGEQDPNFSPELEIARLSYKKRMIDAEIDAQIADLVLLMHKHGKSWEKIGHELGITGEAARLRYGKLERERGPRGSGGNDNSAHNNVSMQNDDSSQNDDSAPGTDSKRSAGSIPDADSPRNVDTVRDSGSGPDADIRSRSTNPVQEVTGRKSDKRHLASGGRP